ncbi:sigma factor-binding protein Crl [Pseudaeromonas sharmana]|uniref:Sigma factor-binding protein Crl n=1 Tax=Pseudaeromonas sharmana TaxID=328412 RepID=A0ABV8CIG4_9GAMM
MSPLMPHRQLIKEFMTLGPYLRQEQCEPGRYFFDCLASCLNLNAAPERREFWGWWLVLESCEGGFSCQSEIGLFNKEGIWTNRQPGVAEQESVIHSRQRFVHELQQRLARWEMAMVGDLMPADPASSLV